METGNFLRDAEKAGMTEGERFELYTFLAASPEAGDLIRQSGGCRKVRWAGKGKGKGGGFRVITFFAGSHMPVVVITVYAKNKLGNLSDAETNTLKLLAKELAAQFRS
jgi:hypothetical protein